MIERSTTHGPERRLGLATLAGFIALTAIGGALGLMTGALELTPAIIARVPGDSYVLAGLALGAWVGIPFTVLTIAALTGSPHTGRLALAAGALLVAWIVVQVVIIRELSWFQPTYLVLGLAVVRAGRRPGRESAAPGRGTTDA